MLHQAAVLVYDDYRMSKQAISVTLSPDNLVWLRGRALADGRVSLSEFLDRLVTRARTGGAPARPARSMNGALAVNADEDVVATPSVEPDVWAAWEAKWEGLLEGLDPSSPKPERRGERGQGA